MTHRAIHVAAFGSSFLVLTLLATGRKEHLKAAAAVLIIGFTVEIIQYLVYSHRQNFEWTDVRDDALGIAIAYIVVQMAGLSRKAIDPRSS